MNRILNRALGWGGGILSVLLMLQFTGCAQVDQLKTKVADQSAFEDGNKALVRSDHAAAAANFRKAAAGGHPQAAYYLGLLSAGGGDIPKDETEALKWMRLAAEQGYAPAQEHLGMWYLTGVMAPENPAEAAAWFRKAADQNDASAMFFLGSMTAKGQGVAKNYDTALMWFQSAAAKGFPVPPGYLTADGVAAMDRASRSAAPPPVQTQTAPPAVQRRPATVKNVQAGLIELGYKPGPADGVMGKNTVNAIRAFQQDANLPVDGRVSEELMQRIEEKLHP